jgi:hypothetical protein
MSRQPRRVREPVQVYLETADKQLLDELSARTSLPRAELLRRGLRRLAAELNAEAEPGHSLSSLIGALGDSADIPSDLAQRHDDYLYPHPDADATGFD